MKKKFDQPLKILKYVEHDCRLLPPKQKVNICKSTLRVAERLET